MVKPEEYEKMLKIARKLAEEEAEKKFGKTKLKRNRFATGFVNVFGHQKEEFIEKRIEFHLKNLMEGKEVDLDIKLKTKK